MTSKDISFYISLNKNENAYRAKLPKPNLSF